MTGGVRKDVPRVALVDCRVTLFAEDLVCILDARPAKDGGGGKTKRRGEGELARGWWTRFPLTTGLSRLGVYPTGSASPAAMFRCLPNFEMHSFSFSFVFSAESSSKGRWLSFLNFRGREPRIMGNDRDIGAS